MDSHCAVTDLHRLGSVAVLNAGYPFFAHVMASLFVRVFPNFPGKKIFSYFADGNIKDIADRKDLGLPEVRLVVELHTHVHVKVGLYLAPLVIPLLPFQNQLSQLMCFISRSLSHRM